MPGHYYLNIYSGTLLCQRLRPPLEDEDLDAPLERLEPPDERLTLPEERLTDPEDLDGDEDL